jgi:hypothetical protein
VVEDVEVFEEVGPAFEVRWSQRGLLGDEQKDGLVESVL